MGARGTGRGTEVANFISKREGGRATEAALRL